MKKKIMLGCAVGLLSLAATAQDEAAPVENDETSFVADAAPEGNAWTVLQDRWYVAPSLSWVFADGGRQTDDGPALTLAVGRPWAEAFALEAFAQFNRLDHEQGSDTADLLGLGVNSLFFPTKKAPAYLLMGAGYGDVSSHPGGEESYSAFLLNVGGGYWWKRFDLGFLKGISLRTDAIWRLDAHNDRRTGDTERNGRKDFQDILLSVGLTVPIGEVAAVSPPPAEVVEVVPVVTPADADGDGVADELDQCPDTPAGAAVDASGCPAAVAVVATCKSPEPGEKLDLAGCGTGDVIVLKGVNFDFNKDRLTPNAKTILDGVGEALKAAPATNVELSGHTDDKGSDEYNQRLSDRRACSVARYLGGQGIAADRMTPAGYGEANPVADNETDEGRELNRRVELKILDGAGVGLGSCDAAAAAPTPRSEPAAVAEPAPEPSTEALSTPEEDSSTASTSDSAPPVEEPAAEMPAPSPAESAPEPAAAPSTAPPAAVSGEAMQMVPEGEVFGNSPPSPDAAAPSATSPSEPVGPAPEASQMVPESEVFGGN